MGSKICSSGTFWKTWFEIESEGTTVFQSQFLQCVYFQDSNLNVKQYCYLYQQHYEMENMSNEGEQVNMSTLSSYLAIDCS